MQIRKILNVHRTCYVKHIIEIKRKKRQSWFDLGYIIAAVCNSAADCNLQQKNYAADFFAICRCSRKIMLQNFLKKLQQKNFCSKIFCRNFSETAAEMQILQTAAKNSSAAEVFANYSRKILLQILQTASEKFLQKNFLQTAAKIIPPGKISTSKIQQRQNQPRKNASIPPEKHIGEKNCHRIC